MNGYGLLRCLRPILVGVFARCLRAIEAAEALDQLGRLGAKGRGLRATSPLRIERPDCVLLGDDVCLNRGLVVRGAGVLRMGSHIRMGQDVRIITTEHSVQGAQALPYDGERIDAGVTISDNVWIGDLVTILPGVVIEEGVVVGAGSVVTRNINSLEIVAGVPARRIGKRDERHYYALKETGAFWRWPREHDQLNGREIRLPRLGRSRK